MLGLAGGGQVAHRTRAPQRDRRLRGVHQDCSHRSSSTAAAPWPRAWRRVGRRTRRVSAAERRSADGIGQCADPRPRLLGPPVPDPTEPRARRTRRRRAARVLRRHPDPEGSVGAPSRRPGRVRACATRARAREFPKYQLGRRVVDETRYARRFAASIARVPPGRRIAVERSSGCSAADGTGVPARRHSRRCCGCRISTRSGCRCCSANGSARLASAPTLVAELARTATRCGDAPRSSSSARSSSSPRAAMVHAPTPVHCIANWAPLSDLPVRPKVNPLSCRLGLDRRFVFLYSGTLGLKHDTERLLELGAHDPGLARRRARRVLRGTGRRHVAAEARDRGLDDHARHRVPAVRTLARAAGCGRRVGRRARPERGVALGAVEGVDVSRRGPARSLPRSRHANSAAEFITAADSGLVVEPTDSVGWAEGARSGCTTTRRSGAGSARTRAPRRRRTSTSTRSPTRFRAVLATAARPEAVAR